MGGNGFGEAVSFLCQSNTDCRKTDTTEFAFKVIVITLCDELENQEKSIERDARDIEKFFTFSSY
ncbi:hypothetical protein KHM19_08970 [Leptospira borgpetersenii]|nr:hypothetical protein KHM09_18330 [Leptospira borgpetersenii]GIM21714.1 hypothetical protein KHM19_08970 [Leptospira borgpetersenii]